MKTTITIVIILLSLSLFGQDGFQRLYTLDNLISFPYDIQETHDKGFIITGYIENQSANKDMLILRVDSTGEIIWQKQFGENATEIAQSAYEDQFGNIYVTGYSYQDGNSNLVYLKFDSLGNTLWQRVLGTNSSDHGWDICLHSDSTNLVIFGYSYGTGPGVNACLLVKINPSGDTLMTRTYGGDFRDYGHSIKPIDDGYILCGHSSSYSDTTLGYENHDAYVLKMDTSFNVIWANAYGLEGREEGNAIAQTQDGDFVFVGVTDAYGNENDMMVIKIDPSGDTLWGRTFGSAFPDEAMDVMVNDQNEILVAGFISDQVTGKNAVVIKLNQQGEVITSHQIAATTYYEGAFAIAPTSDGHFIVCNYTYKPDPVIKKVLISKIDEAFLPDCVEKGNFFNERKTFRIGPGVVTENANLQYKSVPFTPTDLNLNSTIICEYDLVDTSSSPININLSFFPNPVTDQLTIASPNEIKKIMVTDVLGNIVYRNEEVLQYEYNIDFKYYSSGVYLVIMEDGSQSILKKIVKQ